MVRQRVQDTARFSLDDGPARTQCAVIQARASLAGPAIVALAAAPHGRFFLRPSAAAKFLRG